ncbi:uncharacterized protein LOC129818050 [Salvelinus fontinalis]|uniref:uncharacterized protein LOC129818050 n=1 Tax=Salvelinus fontinalis TaxID=8038 RepID=UPI0024868577|nr:uncharacterized protein LOC129818050 [Salvelinus fontinalis]
MTIKKSKTVVFERRAGDLTALYCMNDWMIAVVLAIIAMMSVWAALIIYRYIQTERGKRRRKVDDDTILETEKDENETRNEEKIISCVESTEEGEEVAPETLESWDGEEWKREPMEWIPTTSENVEPFEEIPTLTNEDVEPIEGISATTNEGVKPIEAIPTTNEGVEPIEGIPTTNEGVEPIEGIPTITNEGVKPIEGISATTNEGVEPIEGIPTITNEGVEPITRIRTTTNEDLEPIKQIRARTNEDLQPIRRIRTATNEDLQPIRRIRTATNEDLQPIRRIRTTTNESDGPYTWESYAEWQIVEEFHLGSQPQEHCEGTCQHYDGLCQVCGGLCHCSECLCQFYEGLCQDVAESQTESQTSPRQEEQASTSHYSLSDINYQSGHEKDTDVYNQDEEGLKEVELSDDCQCESTESESEVNHPHAFAIKLQRDLEELHENLPDMILTDSDLTEPDHVCYAEIQEVQYPDDDMTSHVATEMILSDTDPTEPLPKHLCDTDKEEVECPEDYMNIHVNITPQEKRPDMILTNTDLTEPRPEHVCDTEIQEVEYPDDDMTSHVVFSNEPQEERPEMTLTDTEHVSDKKREEVEYPEDDRHSHVAFHKVQESENLPEMRLTDTDRIEPEHVYEVEREEVGVEYPDEVITEGPEHPSENITEILIDTDLQQPGNLCEEEIQEVECTSHYMDSQVAFVRDTQEPEHPNEYLPDMILTDTKTEELDHVCDTEIQEEGTVEGQWKRTVEDDMKEAMVEDLDMEAMVEDLWRKDCLLHDYVIDGLSQPPDVRDTHVAERKGDIVDNKSKDTRVEEEKKRQSDETRIEESYEKVEINIMEATMDYNEWMTVSGTEDNSDSPWVRISHSSIECSSAEAEHHPTETHHNSDDPTVADATAFKEVKKTGTKPVSQDGDLRRNKKMAAVLPIKPKTVRVRFCVHYRTQSPWQELAVTGNQQELGSWTGYVPLERAQDGFWASWVVLPAEKQVEWKLVLVEDGEILRWEEGGNRHLETGWGGREVYLNEWWGSL